MDKYVTKKEVIPDILHTDSRKGEKKMQEAWIWI
uniref:Uncharacterized protein n=1 Tax=Rhizophora mucronata TaxID=61149 RepID=A0A2P2QTT1_RHIMU